MFSSPAERISFHLTVLASWQSKATNPVLAMKIARALDATKQAETEFFSLYKKFTDFLEVRDLESREFDRIWERRLEYHNRLLQKTAHSRLELLELKSFVSETSKLEKQLVERDSWCRNFDARINGHAQRLLDILPGQSQEDYEREALKQSADFVLGVLVLPYELIKKLLALDGLEAGLLIVADKVLNSLDEYAKRLQEWIEDTRYYIGLIDALIEF